jgi:hypothetical protein
MVLANGEKAQAKERLTASRCFGRAEQIRNGIAQRRFDRPRHIAKLISSFLDR